MSIRAKKMATIAFVAAVLGYFCWPYADGPLSKSPATAAKTLEIPTALLSPSAESAPDRDPFNSRAIPSSAHPVVAQGARTTPPLAEGASPTPASSPAAAKVVAVALSAVARQRTDGRG